MAIASINPATGELVKKFAALTPAEAEKKIQLADTAGRPSQNAPYA